MLTRKLTIGAALVAIAAGGGIAYAATKGTSDPQKAYLDNVAKRLNVTPEKLREALKGAADDQIDEAVKNGQLTKEQAERLKARAGNGPLPFVGPPILGHGMRGGFRHRELGFGFRALHAGSEAVAKYLGLSTDELRDELMSGKSLADVAKAQNKDVDGLKKVIVDEAKTQLDKAVDDKMLTREQADKMLSELEDHVDDIVDLTPPTRPRGPRFFLPHP